MNKITHRISIALIFLLSVFFFSCETEKKTCQNILECLDGTVWIPKGKMSYWRIFNNPTGVYLDVHVLKGDCFVYETPQIVGASLVSLNKNSFIEKFDGRNWIYRIINDTVLEKAKITGGNTSYFFKNSQSELDELLFQKDYCD
jgi:hypothetical protein